MFSFRQIKGLLSISPATLSRKRWEKGNVRLVRPMQERSPSGSCKVVKDVVLT